MQAANAPFSARRTAIACATFDRQTGPHHENPSCHILAEYYVVTSYPRRCGVADLVAHTEVADCACVMK